MSYEAFLFMPVPGPLDLPGKITLLMGQLLLKGPKAVDRLIECPIRQRCKPLYSHIDRNRGRGRMHRLLDFHLGLNGDKPVLPFSRYSHIFRGTLDISAFEERYPSYLGKIDCIAGYCKALGIPEGVMDSLLLELWESFGTLLVKSVLERPVLV